jgi:hypothetical protein
VLGRGKEEFLEVGYNNLSAKEWQDIQFSIPQLINNKMEQKVLIFIFQSTPNTCQNFFEISHKKNAQS